jgi:hypothetical protein
MIFWPCILKLEGDDELIYLSSEQFFNKECTELILSDNDYVIDSTGFCYSIEWRTDKLFLTKIERVAVVEDVTHLIRAHEFNKAEVCLTKIHFLTVSDAINSLIYLD